MSMHPRQAIRQQAVTQLLNQTSAGGSVYSTRASPFLSKAWATELPAIAIYTLNETAGLFNSAPRRYERHCDLAIEILVEGNAALDSQLDNLCRQVEILMLADDTLGGLLNDLIYKSTSMDFSDAGDLNIGAARLLFDAIYLDDQPTAESAADLPWLRRVWVDYSLENQQPDPADQAHSHIEDLGP
ncbi:hypothetical protein [Pseudomonas schmalbachii]|uniref:Uncharacterized protein n=1 Tax=Pseudomonas schmalbachii TaxID=2816993 RepID=A0ABS3TKH0_9PSED|nr:hypothetical protein [Pseudomonas schmalbachii]MBO3274132.1 hypothetical protein [Pseudomonas schmalbachii]